MKQPKKSKKKPGLKSTRAGRATTKLIKSLQKKKKTKKKK